MKRQTHRRGSAVILVIALLVLLAMIGMTFIIATHADRGEAKSIERVMPFQSSARAVFQRVQQERMADLYIGAAGPYGAADTVAKTIDYPSDQVDAMLASNTPQVTAAGRLIWPHVSNPLGGMSATNVDITNPLLVDTDGYSWNFGGQQYSGDALPFDSGLLDEDGRHIIAAVRVVDQSGQFNANMAYAPSYATANWPMNATEISVQALLPNSYGCLHSVRAGAKNPYVTYWFGTNDDLRTYWKNYGNRPYNIIPNAGYPYKGYVNYDMADMIGVLWGGQPSTAYGWLHAGCKSSNDQVDDYYGARPFLTTWSAERIFVPQRAALTAADQLKFPGRTQRVKADLNTAGLAELYTAFYNALPFDETVPANKDLRRQTAAQLAVNVIDFRDMDRNVTVAKIDATTGDISLAADTDTGGVGYTLVYGIERQPFVSKVYQRKEWAADGQTVVRQYSVIELFNPYQSDISLGGYRLKVGGVSEDLTDQFIVPAGQKSFIVSDTAAGPASNVKFDPNLTTYETSSGRKRRWLTSNLDLSQDVKILRRRVLSSATTPVDVVIATAKVSLTPAAGAVFRTTEWDDVAGNCRWAVGSVSKTFTDVGHDYTSASPVDLPGGLNSATFGTLATNPPCPVFVRTFSSGTGTFLNVGELFRILCVGPAADKSLQDNLATGATPFSSDTSVFNGRLPMNQDGGGVAVNNLAYPANMPALPLGCLAQDYLMVNSPAADGVDNDGDGITDNAGEEITYGKININTAPQPVLAGLPGLLCINNPNADPVTSEVDTAKTRANEIAAYRDRTQYKDFFGRGAVPATTDYTNPAGVPGLGTGGPIAGLRKDGAKGFASVGEAALLLNKIVPPSNSYGPVGSSYKVCGTDSVPSDDGLPDLAGDFTKNYAPGAWISNHITVRSDVYAVYVTVMGANAQSSGTATNGSGNGLTDTRKNWQTDQYKGMVVAIVAGTGAGQFNTVSGNGQNNLTTAAAWTTQPDNTSKYQICPMVRHYVGVIDRSNCRTVNDLPYVMMFSEIK